MGRGEREEEDEKGMKMCYIQVQIPSKDVIIMYCKHILIKKEITTKTGKNKQTHYLAFILY